MKDDGTDKKYFYYDPATRVVAEYADDSQGGQDIDRWYVYGNGIDEVLAMYLYEHSYSQDDLDEFYDFVDCWLCADGDTCWSTCYLFNAVTDTNDLINYRDMADYGADWNLPTGKETRWYYLHDALGSVAGIVGGNYKRDSDREFYLYEVYGKPDYISEAGNPYMFTGRRVDVIDDNCYIQYNRNRYYSYNLERWLSPDPLGVVPNPVLNVYNPLIQYSGGMNLYEYVRSNPVNMKDSWGLMSLGTKISGLLASRLIGFPPALTNRLRSNEYILNDEEGEMKGLLEKEAINMKSFYSQVCSANKEKLIRGCVLLQTELDIS